MAMRAAAGVPSARRLPVGAEVEGEGVRFRAWAPSHRNEPQPPRLVRPAREKGCALDAVWNDDFHHSATAALTGRAEAYYGDTRGSPQELVSRAKRGFLYQGQRYRWQRKRRGTPTAGVPPRAFVCYLQNHDQVANSARGKRVHEPTSPGRHRAMTALLLLGPSTPMLFQGEETSSPAPFLYFADHAGELGTQVRTGRARFLRQFRSIAAPDMRDRLDDPSDPALFERCKLDPAERERRGEAWALHRDLLALRREDPTLALQGEAGLDGAVLGREAFCLLLRRGWALLWSSEHPSYGGGGTPRVEDDDGFHLAGHAAALLAARREDEHAP